MSSKRGFRLLLAAAVAGLLPACGNINDGHPAVPFTVRASVSSFGDQTNQNCDEVWLSGNGRFIVFRSPATNLAQAGAPTVNQVFRHDLATGVTEMVSVDPTLAPGDDASGHPSISFDGRFIAFESFATNLLAAPEFVPHVYVRDMDAPPATATVLASQNSAGDPGDDFSFSPSISQDGRFVAFASLSTNLGDTHASGLPKIYRRDMSTTDVIPISVTPLGGDPAGNITTTEGSVTPSISADGSVIAFMSDCIDVVAGDSNNKRDVFVATVGGGGAITTVMASPKLGGGAANGHSESPAISGDGLLVAFHSAATNLVAVDSNSTFIDVYVFSIADGSVRLVSVNSQGIQAELGADSRHPSISSDGRFVAFESVASNLGEADTNLTNDVFIRDMVSGSTVRVSLDSSGNQAGIGMPSTAPSLSGDAKAVAFSSKASFVKDDTNGLIDAYVRSPLR